MSYDRVQPVMYLVAKIEKMMAICDFLDTLAKNNNEDVDKIKIFQLISYFEIIMNTFSTSADSTKANLIDDFFKPVEDKLQYVLRLTINETNKLSKIKQIVSPSRILYKVRCEYVHQGNFTGKVFKTDDTGKEIYHGFSFNWDIPKSTALFVCAKIKLTYNQFLNIYFFAFVAHFENYISKSL